MVVIWILNTQIFANYWLREIVIFYSRLHVIFILDVIKNLFSFVEYCSYLEKCFLLFLSNMRNLFLKHTNLPFCLSKDCVGIPHTILKTDFLIPSP